jgi:hypothetical protein
MRFVVRAAAVAAATGLAGFLLAGTASADTVDNNGIGSGSEWFDVSMVPVLDQPSIVDEFGQLLNPQPLDPPIFG